MTDTIIDTNVLGTSSNGHPNGMAGTTQSNNGSSLVRNTVRELLGDRVRLSELMSLGNLDTHEGFAHTTTSLPYAIHGTATIVNRDVASYLAGFEDPIKSIMGVGIHRERKIIIKRKYVVGGQALIVPERAPARTVAIQEDAREVLLTRYGGDLEMNLNLFHQPEEARRELEMKVTAQREALEQTLVDIGYETVLGEGINLMAALQRASPATAAMSPTQRSRMAERIYIQSVFGCMAKNPFPVHNLLAACSKANLYTPAGGGRSPFSVMIVPPGMDLHKYTRPDEMVFNISGLAVNQHEKIAMPLRNVLTDTVSNLRILVHVPSPSQRHGAAHPQVESSGLTGLVGWATYYPLTLDENNMYTARITDFKARSFADIKLTKEQMGKIDADDEKNARPILVRPKMMAMMSSAILCTRPGSESGELLMAYPQTGISTSQTTETMKMQLRVYLGAAVYTPENYVVIPDIQFEGLVGGHGSKVCTGNIFDPEEDDLFTAWVSNDFVGENLLDDPIFRETAGKRFYGDYLDMQEHISEGHFDKVDGAEEIGRVTGSGFNTEDGVPLRFFQGATWRKDKESGWVQETINSGHLGTLDNPMQCDRLDGIQRFIPLDGFSS